MSEVVRRLWYENILSFMEQEIRVAKDESRVINAVAMTCWGQLIRPSRMNTMGRKRIVEGLEHLLELIPHGEDTLGISTAIKYIQTDLKRRRFNVKATS